MTALNTDDLAVITGPLVLDGFLVGLAPGEVVRIIRPGLGASYVHGVMSNQDQWINTSSLTPLSEIHKDTTIEWGAEDEQYVRLSSTHDYVYTGDDE